MKRRRGEDDGKIERVSNETGLHHRFSQVQVKIKVKDKLKAALVQVLPQRTGGPGGKAS